ARRTGEAVILTHGLDADDTHRNGHVFHHATDDDELLKVLLPEISSIRPYDIEELADHRRDTGEVAGTRLAFHLVAERGYIHNRLHGTRIHVADRWREKIIDTGPAQQSCVALLIPRIFVEFFICAELQRNDEDGHDSHIVFRSGSMNQFKLAVVDIAHGRHKAEPFFSTPCGRQSLTQLLYGADDLHEVLLATEIYWPRVLPRQLKYDNCRGKCLPEYLTASESSPRQPYCRQ